MESKLVVTYRMRGSDFVHVRKYDLTDPYAYENYESFIDSIRAHQIGEGMDAVIVPGKVDHFVVSFE